jgi:hypothetical protein
MSFSNTCLDSGYTSVRDIPGLDVDQCTDGDVEFLLRNPSSGQPINLTDYDITDSSSSSSSGNLTGVMIVLKELPSDNNAWYEEQALIVDAAAGKIRIAYTAHDVRRAGIFTGEAQIWQDGLMKRIFPFFFNVNPSLSGSAGDSLHVLSVAEIRMTLRDTDPEANTLLDELEYKQEEIMLAIRRCIQYWNEVPPPIGTYKPTNFPFPYHLSIGVASILYGMATHLKLRNDLDYSAGGVTVKDTMDWPSYREMQDRLWQQWTDWVKATKYRMNIEGAFKVLGSGYGYGYGRYYR